LGLSSYHFTHFISKDYYYSLLKSPFFLINFLNPKPALHFTDTDKKRNQFLPQENRDRYKLKTLCFSLPHGLLIKSFYFHSNQTAMEACSRKRRRRRAYTTSTTGYAAVFFCGIFVFAQFGISSSALFAPDHYPSLPRKAGHFHEMASFQAPKATVSFTGQRREEENRDEVYKDDKRLVHTGPNPLHN